MNRDNQGRLRHAAGAPASLGGKYAPDSSRGGAAAAATPHKQYKISPASRKALESIDTSGEPMTEERAQQMYSAVIKSIGYSRGIDRAELDIVVGGDTRRIDNVLKLAKENGVGATLAGDDLWPSQLDDLGKHTPAMLWSLGDMGNLPEPEDAVSITGSRASSNYGEEVARELAEASARSGKSVVTGGAYGIEGIAMRTALRQDGDGNHVIVTAGSPERPYPHGHTQLFADAVKGGGVVISETPPGDTPTRFKFSRAQKLKAAMSGTSVIVEASPRGGSVQLAREASGLGDREVFAVPGPITSANSLGANMLIQDGVAKALVSASDLLDENDER